MVTRQDIVNTAEAELGSTNWAKYLSYCGYDFKTDWCNAFVTWVFGQHGLNGLAVRYNSINCTPSRDWFIARDRYITDKVNYLPQPGDNIFYHWSTGTPGKVQHIGIVRYADANYVYTIEGNVDFVNGISRVAYKKRSRSYTPIEGYGIPDMDNVEPWQPGDPDVPGENPYDPPDETEVEYDGRKRMKFIYYMK